MHQIISVKEHMREDEVLEVLKESVYRPTIERLNSRAELYMKSSNISAFGLKRDHKLCGVIVLDCSHTNQLVIMDIAVLKCAQKQGIGSSLIKYAKAYYQPKMIVAETDHDAVGFYKRFGFEINSLGEKHPGITRYQCKYDCSESTR